MITVIGTGHVFNLSTAIMSTLTKIRPDMVCVELDQQRYNALIRRNSSISCNEGVSSTPPVYKLLSKFQENIAKEYGVKSGDEMLTAIDYAHNAQIHIELIDMNAQQLFTHMWSSMSFIEKIRLLFGSLFGGFFITRKRIEKELENFQENYESYIKEISKKFPTIKKTLIDDRNKHMANRLIQLNEDYSNIAVLVGDGHISGMAKLLRFKKIEFKIIRLKELRDNDNINDSSTRETYSFTTEYKPPS
ncbi:putative PrgY-like protein, pheromone shutdown like protein [Thermoplasmatales archaeon SCGC AB-539-N05]|nr:putative PrgY-like protein, pheromone shutdown like protein [Thermoplasmatales archaeon SCGC AB-539-N05]